jgi:hypothetical protein
MKNIFYTTLMVITFGLSQISNAQITLEHTFTNESVKCTGLGYYAAAWPENSYYSTEVVNNSCKLKVYNSDYSINTNQTCTFTLPAGYKAQSATASQKIFNEDDNYEFVVTFNKTNSVGRDNESQKTILYDKNGNILKDFGTGYMMAVYSSLYIINNHYKLLVYRYLYDAENNLLTSTEIYSVPGTVSAGVRSANASNSLLPYPNPANTTITLPYNLKQDETSVMHILDISGKLIETKQIDSVFDKILLNVSTYAKGIYIYEVNGISSRFIVE